MILDSFFQGSADNIKHLEGDSAAQAGAGRRDAAAAAIEAAKGMDGVLHLAALMSITMDRDPWMGLDVNIRGTQNAIEACCINGVKKLVFTSSSAVYGYGPGLKGDLVETTPFLTYGAPPGAIIYGASKIIGEQLCRDAFAKRGLDYVVVRYSTVYGERQHYRADQRALHHRDARPRAPGPAPARHRRRLGHQALRARQRCGARQCGGLRRRRHQRCREHLGAEARPRRSRSCASSRSWPARTWRPSTSSRRRARCSLTSGGAWKMDHALAERTIGWKPQVDMREGIKRLLAWREASGK